MRFSTSLILPVLITAASATPDAVAYLFQGDEILSTSQPPKLSTEQARLVIAQRLGASKYHDLGDASEATLSYINKFGGQPKAIFQDIVSDEAAELVVIVEGVSASSREQLVAAWSSQEPAFTISNPPSMVANLKLREDLSLQVGDDKSCPLWDSINPFGADCWSGKSKIIHFDLAKVGQSVICSLGIAN